MPTLQDQRVAVFGATGHTGRFVVDELLRRGMTPVAVARDSVKLAASGFPERGIATRCASIDDPASLDDALRGVAAVINCAGPFLETADRLAVAAIRNSVHYLDVSAEQPSAHETLKKFAGPAQEAGVFILPAMGFYGGLADLLATAVIGDWNSVDENLIDEIRVGIALNSWHPTPGTRITGARNTAQRLVVNDGHLVPLAQPAPEVSWDFPEPFGRQDAIAVPFSEVILMKQHLNILQLHTYLNLSSLRDIRDPATPPPAASDESGRSSQIFLIEVIARKDGHTRRLVAQGRDIYAFTAPLVCEAVARILRGDVLKSCGAHAPGAIFDAKNFLHALAPDLTCSFEAV
ncbi:saccharopine dehydrogenase family protein [Undibacterium sp. Di26W]|uniref:saccharopine dehydrogenase family protein n=1 Tax=Undibacterium sp. Di26W TaxID=3413035 RepID=UPI003BEFA7EF